MLIIKEAPKRALRALKTLVRGELITDIDFESIDTEPTVVRTWKAINKKICTMDTTHPDMPSLEVLLKKDFGTEHGMIIHYIKSCDVTFQTVTHI